MTRSSFMTQPEQRHSIGLIKSLVGVRAVLSAIIVLIHLSPFALALAPVGAPVWNAFAHHGYASVDIFVVLSGFVVTAGYRTRFARWPGFDTYGRFLWARLSRFYPLHLTVLAILVGGVAMGALFGFPVPHTGNFHDDLVRQVLLLHGFGGARTLTWNGPTWSLSAEWFCYLIIPLIIPVVLRLRTQASVILGFLAASAMPLVAYGFIGYDDAAITYQAPLFRAVGAFVAGSMLCQLTHVPSRLPELAGRFTGLLTGLFLAATVVAASLDITMLSTVPFGALVVLALAQQRGRIDALLSGPKAMKAGDLSVTVFLTHVPWILGASLLITPVTFPGAWGWLGIAILVSGAIVIAYLAFRFVEQPSQKLMRRMVPSKRPAPAPPAVDAAVPAPAIAG
jgi:peptidoglycan/LPS O-acetylase OafA/YrhL